MSLRPPPRSARRLGATDWVWIAIGFTVLGVILNQGDVVPLFSWLTAILGTLAWVIAAGNARSVYGRVVLWIVVLALGVFWAVIFDFISLGDLGF